MSAPTLVLIDGKPVQCTLKDEPEWASEVPEHTNEDGTPVSDTAKDKLQTLDLDGVFTEVKGPGDRTMSPQDFHDFMEELMRTKRVVTVFCPVWSFPTMKCISYKPKRRSQTSISFTSKWKEWRVVNSRSQTVKVTLGTKTKKGRVETAPVQPKNLDSALGDVFNVPNLKPGESDPRINDGKPFTTTLPSAPTPGT